VRALELSIGVSNFSFAKTGIFADSLGGAGDGGRIQVEANNLEIFNGGLISTKTVGPGRGGDTVVDAKSLLIDRGASPYFTGIVADSATNAPEGTPAGFAGPGGSVRVNADVVRVVNGGQISATTETQGRGGEVRVTARDLMLDGHVGDAISSISSDSITTAGKGGDSGGVNVTADRLVISDGARISATTFGNGDAGSVRVNAGTALLSGTGTDFFTGIAAATVSPTLAGAAGTVRAEFDSLVIRDRASIVGNTFGSGRGGDVIVTSNTARLFNGGQISADTSGLGVGGSIDFSGSSLLISGVVGDTRSGIFSDSSATGRGGMAGSVRVEAGEAQVLDGGAIAATSSSSGQGGSVRVAADRLVLNRTGSIEASATGKGDAGSVEIHVAEPLELLGQSGVRTTSAKSDAGTVLVESASDINIEEGSSVTVQALTGNAGRIALMTPHRLLVRNSTLLAEAGLNGGDIFIDPEYIVLDHGIISANAVNVGGNILLVADNFLPSSTPITATGSTAGTVQISAPQLDLSGALASLTAQLVDASLRFQERCAMRLGGEVSSFLVLGRGGVEDSPADPAIVLSRRKMRPAEEETNRAR
jgi:large exoprotein involved in heme utilization and adhesion